MQNRLDSERQARKKATREATRKAKVRRAATTQWLKCIRPLFSRIATDFRLRLSKHSGKFVFADDEGDVLVVFWSSKVTLRWPSDRGEADALSQAVALAIQKYPKS